MLARRGVALDKCPGVRPVGVGEVIQRICAKTMALTTGEDVQEICGAQQLCSGIKSGLEGAIQGFSSLFDDDDTEGILLVDARNAFNVLNRQVALWNVRILWPRCCRFLFNTYRGFSIIMFRNSDETLLSMEGTTQGDPLAMLFYGIGVMPLIKKLMSPDWVQNWYADDSACIGKLSMIRKWIDLLRIEGPKYGYYPEPNKSFLVIKPQFLEEASLLFHDLHVQIVTEKRFLGGVIGNGDEKKNYVKEKVNQWIDCVKKLSEAAKKSPQAAFSVVTKSLQCEWAFLQRVVNHCQDEYIPLREIIHSTLVPSIFEHEISSSEHELFHLPTRFGGLGINDPVETAQHAFAVTSEKCKVLVDSLLKQEQLNLQEHNQCVKNAINTELVRKETEYQEKQERILSSLPPAKQRVLTRIVEGKSSQWLNVIPKSSDNFDLSPVQFRDALALRYNHGLKGLPTYCDGCGGEMSVTHALNCKKGGLVKHGHDYLRDECIMMASYAWNGIVKEPIMRDSSSTSPALIADFKINGVWEAGGTAFFDNRIVNADAPSYSSQTWNTIAKRHAQEKHLKYNTAAEDLRASFTPLVCSTDGALHLEFHSFLKRIALVLSEKWKKMYGHVLSWLRVRTEFSILKAVSLRLRGTRQIVKPYGFDDGAGLMYIVD
ncbi:hypothetical protein M8J77_013571 [Diaphorina citri]|nr:hypothetical protein M8J77_013571 [Diaphorina citri]